MRCGVCADPFIPFAIKRMTTETGMLAPSDKRGRGTRVLNPRFYAGSRRRRHDTDGVLSWRGKTCLVRSSDNCPGGHRRRSISTWKGGIGVELVM